MDLKNKNTLSDIYCEDKSLYIKITQDKSFDDTCPIYCTRKNFSKVASARDTFMRSAHIVKINGLVMVKQIVNAKKAITKF